jgi:hypothetical protein
MKQDNSHSRIQDDSEQAKTFPSKHVSLATITVDQEKKSFTEKDKATLRGLLLDLIFAEPRKKLVWSNYFFNRIIYSTRKTGDTFLYLLLSLLCVYDAFFKIDRNPVTIFLTSNVESGIDCPDYWLFMEAGGKVKLAKGLVVRYTEPCCSTLDDGRPISVLAGE